MNLSNPSRVAKNQFSLVDIDTVCSYSHTKSKSVPRMGRKEKKDEAVDADNSEKQIHMPLLD